MKAPSARKLPTRMVDKVWGRDALPTPFATPRDKRIGEIWFEPPPELPQLLVKYLFTSEKLSVQVHPSDAQAKGEERGKEECWLVLDAEPGAKLAIGFERDHAKEEIAAAALDGSIETLLKWHEARAGDTFYLPAGTVHAIGPGLSLVEVQQASDTTFRLYDYGRPRELHLDRALAVADCGRYDCELAGHALDDRESLIEGPYFRMDRAYGEPSEELRQLYAGALLALPLEGRLRAGSIAAKAGECLFAPHIDALDFREAGSVLLTRPIRARRRRA